jgi:hypothetical protein
MDKEPMENLDAAVQDVDGANNDNNASVTEDLIAKKAFEDQKKRAEQAEARAKELEEKLKQQTGNEQPAGKPEEKSEIISNDREESFLVSVFGAKNLEYDEINTYLEKAKKIAQVEGLSLSKAIETDYFKAFDKTYQADKKSKIAQMNASNGSGASASKRDLSTPGLSDEEFDRQLKAKIFGQN